MAEVIGRSGLISSGLSQQKRHRSPIRAAGVTRVRMLQVKCPTSSTADINAFASECLTQLSTRAFMELKDESKKKDVKLEARIIISMEYPLRPPLFHVNICTAPAGGSYPETEVNEWYNESRAIEAESRAIEAEVNLRVLRMLPWDQENYVLAHQVHCLALLFDLYFDEAYMSSDSGKTEPVHDKIKTRLIRGRDRRKMISWSDMESTQLSKI
ncbi:hypothetical protein QQ045_018403 [Rhodiola kirilowii]